MNSYWQIKNNKSNVKDSYFSKNNYHFFPSKKTNSFKSNLFEFNILIQDDIDIVSILNYFRYPNSPLTVLDKYPIKTTELIEKFDNNIDDNYLFHDIKTQYILFIEIEQFKSKSNGIVFIGVTVLDKQIRFCIKTFNKYVIRDIHEIIIEEIRKNVCILEINYIENIKWLLVNQYEIYQKKHEISSLEKSILFESINSNYELMYRNLFEKLILKGYITVDERTEIAKLAMKKGAKFRNILKRYLKLPVEDGKATLIQDEIANNIQDDDKNSMYTFSAQGWKYFMNNWFEDYIGQALNSIKDVKIEQVKSGGEFSFNEVDPSNNKIEIDWLILASKDGISKIIAIECKRTLTIKKIKDIKDKYDTKLIKTSNHSLIDGFINIGYFLPKRNTKTGLKYNEIYFDKLSVGSNIEKEFLTFVSNSFKNFSDNLTMSIIHILNEGNK